MSTVKVKGPARYNYCWRAQCLQLA